MLLVELVAVVVAVVLAAVDPAKLSPYSSAATPPFATASAAPRIAVISCRGPVDGASPQPVSVSMPQCGVEKLPAARPSLYLSSRPITRL